MQGLNVQHKLLPIIFSRDLEIPVHFIYSFFKNCVRSKRKIKYRTTLKDAVSALNKDDFTTIDWKYLTYKSTYVNNIAYGIIDDLFEQVTSTHVKIETVLRPSQWCNQNVLRLHTTFTLCLLYSSFFRMCPNNILRPQNTGVEITQLD